MFPHFDPAARHHTKVLPSYLGSDSTGRPTSSQGEGQDLVSASNCYSNHNISPTGNDNVGNTSTSRFNYNRGVSKTVSFLTRSLPSGEERKKGRTYVMGGAWRVRVGACGEVWLSKRQRREMIRNGTVIGVGKKTTSPQNRAWEGKMKDKDARQSGKKQVVGRGRGGSRKTKWGTNPSQSRGRSGRKSTLNVKWLGWAGGNVKCSERKKETADRR